MGKRTEREAKMKSRPVQSRKERESTTVISRHDTFPVWSAGRVYQPGDKVWYRGGYYEAALPHCSNDFSATDWKSLTSTGEPTASAPDAAWCADKFYHKGDRVWFRGGHYEAKYDHQSLSSAAIELPSSSLWQKLDDGAAKSPWSKDRDVPAVATFWETGREYKVGELVQPFSGDAIYECIIDHTSDVFASDFHKKKWKLALFEDDAARRYTTQSQYILELTQRLADAKRENEQMRAAMHRGRRDYGIVVRHVLAPIVLALTQKLMERDAAPAKQREVAMPSGTWCVSLLAGDSLRLSDGVVIPERDLHKVMRAAYAFAKTARDLSAAVKNRSNVLEANRDHTAAWDKLREAARALE